MRIIPGQRCVSLIAPVLILLAAHLLHIFLPVSGFVGQIPLRANDKIGGSARGLTTRHGASGGAQGMRQSKTIGGVTSLMLGKSPLAALAEVFFGQPALRGDMEEEDGKKSGIVVRTGARQMPVDDTEAGTRSPTKVNCQFHPLPCLIGFFLWILTVSTLPLSHAPFVVLLLALQPRNGPGWRTDDE